MLQPDPVLPRRSSERARPVLCLLSHHLRRQLHHVICLQNHRGHDQICPAGDDFRRCPSARYHYLHGLHNSKALHASMVQVDQLDKPSRLRL